MEGQGPGLLRSGDNAKTGEHREGELGLLVISIGSDARKRVRSNGGQGELGQRKWRM